MVFYHTEMYSKDADRLAYSKDPDQTDKPDVGLLFLITSVRQRHWTILVSVNGQVHNGISTQRIR